MEEKHIVTIDLGTDKMGISVATIDANKKVSVIYYNEFPSDGIRHSRVTNPTKLNARIKEALSIVESVNKIHITEVMVGVQRYGLRQLDYKVSGTTANGNVSEKDIDLIDNLAWESRDAMGIGQDEDIIACIAQSYDLDGGEVNVSPDEVVGMCSDNVVAKYKVYTLRQNAINVIDNAFRDTDVINVRKVFVPDAIGSSILSQNEIQGGVALIDLGAGASSVSIFTGGVLRHYGAIPFGGYNITCDIANVCSISEKLAENIKMAYGGCMPDRLGTLGEKKLRITDVLDKSRKEVSVKYLSEIITAREKEIIEALLYDIQTSGYADKLKNGIVVTGGGASMLNICTFIKETSGYNTKVGATSRDRMESDCDIFYSLGASCSSGLLRKYSMTETAGCDQLVQKPEAPATFAHEQEKDAPEESGSDTLFGDSEGLGGFNVFGRWKSTKIDKGEKKKKRDLIGAVLGTPYDNAKAEKERNAVKDQPKPEKTGSLFDFGEDEDI